MNTYKEYWDNIYRTKTSYPNYDGWLDKYFHILKTAQIIIDLGCGDGVDTLFLKSKGIDTIACDYSETALTRIKSVFPNANTLCFDMCNELPFNNKYADIIITDLSLHYFDWNTTNKIIAEIFRILMPDGVLLCRVNSEKEYSANPNDIIIESRFYNNGENLKRFFNEADIKELFSKHEIFHLSEDITNKYGENKQIWEIAVKAKLN